MGLKKNTIETYDSFFNADQKSFAHTYFDVGHMYPEFRVQPFEMGSANFDQGTHWSPGQLTIFEIYLHHNKVEHTRKVYKMLDLISELGGVLNIATTIAGMLIYSISEHSFIIRAL